MRAAHPISVRMRASRNDGLSFDIGAAFSGGASGLTRAQRVARIDALATLMDTAFLVPGTNIRFGFDALLGLVPGIGDVITTAMSLYIVKEARSLGAPRWIVARMLGNVALDGVVGAVPLVGDLFDVAFRANRKNLALLQNHLAGEPRAYYGPRSPSDV